jgi:hypothetical protein
MPSTNGRSLDLACIEKPNLAGDRPRARLVAVLDIDLGEELA